MSSFEQLHPALQHHIVNSLGWRDLRPLQETSIDVVLAGKHCLLIAPTAGGKTEAAVFPLFSRVLQEDWRGLTVLYLCPLKALLNNLHERLDYYARLVGRTCAVWHGDVPESQRERIRREPPDILLTTPESVEAMLVSRKTDNSTVFGQLQAVVIDEVHAFAGDDRGWHVLALLERLVRIAGRELQRLALSATVGNPEELLIWLCGHCAGEGVVIAPEESNDSIDVQLDYVASLDNAATVISRLHRGEKRLVFCDSRSRVEALAALLRKRDIDAFVSHSSLSADERRRSERAFADGRNCVIVATSALELGIDVGDLDRVIQIDAPATVSSFLQRIGRTGRRVGSRRNCLLLATSDSSLIHAAALIELWASGYVEPIEHPPLPFHVFIQQCLGLLLQEGGLSARDLIGWLMRVPQYAALSQGHGDEIITYMIEKQILSSDAGILWFGPLGEKLYGYRNFMDVSSIFTSPPMFSVRHGRQEVGFVHECSFVAAHSLVLLLAGRAWHVRHIDWDRKIAQVEPTDLEGRSRWLGLGADLSIDMCQSMKRVLRSERDGFAWSKRAQEAMDRIREEYFWVSGKGLTVRHDAGKGSQIWSFAGRRANRALALVLLSTDAVDARAENLYVNTDGKVNEAALAALSPLLLSEDHSDIAAEMTSDLGNSIKFVECLPPGLKGAMVQRRYFDFERATRLLGQRSDNRKAALSEMDQPGDAKEVENGNN